MLTIDYINAAIPEDTRNPQSIVAYTRGGGYIPTMKKACADLGDVRTTAAIKAMLIRLNMLLNLPRPMTEQFIESCSSMIVKKLTSKYWDTDINFADLRNIFSNAAEGKYGKFYGGLGTDDILGWIDTYTLEKEAAIEQWHHDTYHEDRKGSVCEQDREGYRHAVADYLSGKITRQ